MNLVNNDRPSASAMSRLWAATLAISCQVRRSHGHAQSTDAGRASQGLGQTLVEFALVVPVLLLLLGGAIDLGRVFYSQIAITGAAREGALWAVQHPGSWNEGCDAAAITPTNPDQVTCHAIGESKGGFATVTPADITCSSTDPASGVITPCAGASPAPGGGVWVTVRGTFTLAIGGVTLPMSATATGRIALAPGNAPPSDQAITFTSIPPSPAYVGYTYTPVAVSTSLLPVTLTIDAASSSVCRLSGGVVSLLAIGTCTIDANQAGDATHNPAPEVSQSFAVLPIPPDAQTITFASMADRTLGSGSFEVLPNPTASSGLPVTLTATTPSICTVSGFVVSLHAKGLCSITATQPGGADASGFIWQAAPDVIRAFTVATSCVKPTGGIDGSPGVGKATTNSKVGDLFTFTWTGPAVPAKCDGIETVWSWAFGDGTGTTSTPNVATYTYPIGTTNGVKTVTLTVSVGDDPNLSTTFTTTVRVN